MLHISGTIYTSYDCHLWYIHLCKMVISPGFLFQFFKIGIFIVGRRVRGQKMAQNDKNFYLLCLTFQVTYII